MFKQYGSKWVCIRVSVCVSLPVCTDIQFFQIKMNIFILQKIDYYILTDVYFYADIPSTCPITG